MQNNFGHSFHFFACWQMTMHAILWGRFTKSALVSRNFTQHILLQKAIRRCRYVLKPDKQKGKLPNYFNFGYTFRTKPKHLNKSSAGRSQYVPTTMPTKKAEQKAFNWNYISLNERRKNFLPLVNKLDKLLILLFLKL